MLPLAAFLLGSVSCSSGLVNVGYAKFQGLVDTTAKTVTHLGIPYAKAPIGPLRFAAPVPVETKVCKKLFNATTSGFSCPGAGIGYQQSEDCLNLNIYAPQNAKNLPVVVYVYGGSFTSGSNNNPERDGRFILARTPDVVVVSVNYRLGALGFLASAELEAEGSINVPLKDLKVAFEWVRAHISAFGGDAKRVTAMAHSAGAIMVGTHLIANPDQQMFDRAILLSGAAQLTPYTVAQREPIFQAYATALKCNGTVSPLACLRTIPLAYIMAVPANPLYFGITVGGDYVTQETAKYYAAITKSYTGAIPLLLHTNRDEGSIFTAGSGITTTRQAQGFRRLIAPPYYTEAISEQVDAIYPPEQYPQGPFAAAGAFFGDALLACPPNILARALSKAKNSLVFQVRNNHLPLIDRRASFGFSNTTDIGVYHGSELPYLFQVPSLIAPGELVFSQRLHDAYLRFARGMTPLKQWREFGSLYQLNRYNIEENVMVKDTDRDIRCNFIERTEDTYLGLQPAAWTVSASTSRRR